MTTNLAAMVTDRQVRAWSGVEDLTEDELTRIKAAIPHSSIPDGIGVIVDAVLDKTR